MEAASTAKFLEALNEADLSIDESNREHSLLVIAGLLELSKEIRRLQISVDDISKKIK